jgi:ribosome-associated translation inhibitor RaiA
MRIPVEISLRGIPVCAALERYINEQSRQLGRQCERIRACHVAIEALHRRGQAGAQFAVRLNLMLPGIEVAVNREHAEDVYIAVREAFEAASVQVSDHMRRQDSLERRSGSPNPGGKL